VDRPLVVKRASDLLSRWVGGTEAAIADTFSEARERGHVLLFDGGLAAVRPHHRQQQLGGGAGQ
jgi:SpoVK/Ycf46/Vps4 family AAA+-type ATPase